MVPVRTTRKSTRPGRSACRFRRNRTPVHAAADPVRSRVMPDFDLVAPFEPTGDQPKAIERLRRRPDRWAAPPDPARAPPARARRSRWRRSSRPTTSRRWSSPTTRRWPPSSTPSSASSSRTTPSSTSSATSTTTSPRPTCPGSDTYIEKDSSRNDEIDRLRHAATHALFERRDVIIVATRLVHLRPRCPGRLRRDRAPAADRWQVPPRCRPAPPRRPPVPAQRPGAQPRAVPRPRRHPRVPAGLGGDGRPGRVLRRRSRADHRDRPADRRAAGRAQGDQRLPGDPLRDPARQAQGGDRRYRGRDGGAGRRAGGGGPGARGRAAAPAHDVRPRDAARARLLLRASRTTRDTWPGAKPDPGRGRCSTTSRRTGCSSSTNRT